MESSEGGKSPTFLQPLFQKQNARRKHFEMIVCMWGDFRVLANYMTTVCVRTNGYFCLLTSLPLL